EVRRHPPAHRLAADEEFRRLDGAMLDGCGDGVPERVLEHGRAIGRSPLFFHVGKVEGHDRDPARGKGSGVTGYKRVRMTGAGAVREDEEGIEGAVTFRNI